MCCGAFTACKLCQRESPGMDHVQYKRQQKRTGNPHGFHGFDLPTVKAHLSSVRGTVGSNLSSIDGEQGDGA